MNISKKAIAILLLATGLSVFIFGILNRFSSKKVATNDRKSVESLATLGVLTTAVGGYVALSLQDDAQRQERDRRRALLHRLIKAGNGRVSVVDFSLETGLSSDETREFLNEQAYYLNATFQEDQQGEGFYQFKLGYADADALLSESTSQQEEAPLTYSVLLHSISVDCEDAILIILQGIMDVEPEAIKQHWAEPLMPIQTQLPMTIAKEYRDRLEEAGAKVLITLE